MVAASLGRIESIHVAPSRGDPMQGLGRVQAIAGVGLEGDRYALGLGTYSPQEYDEFVRLLEG